MDNPENTSKRKSEKSDHPNAKKPESAHLGSSDAFTKTESPLSKDPDDISDEKLDELLDDE
jgi:hypothetical protein